MIYFLKLVYHTGVTIGRDGGLYRLRGSRHSPSIDTIQTPTQPAMGGSDRHISPLKLYNVTIPPGQYIREMAKML